MNTLLEDLNDDQYEALKQFKNDVGDVLPSDYPDSRLVKWLRTHNYNLKKSEASLRAAMKSREIYDLDKLAENYEKPEIVKKYEFASFMGFAKDGSAIRYTRFGDGDLAGFIMSLSGYEIVIYCTYLIEYDMAQMKKYSEKNGKNASEITYIVDLDCLSIGQFMQKSLIETGLDLLQMMQDNYPESWGNIFIVNAPSYFDKVFNIFKPILRLNMLQKIRVVSRESTPSLLLKYIDESTLPVFLGGKKTDSSGDPSCKEFISFGGRIPEDLYLRNRIPLLQAEPSVTSLWVSPRSVYNYSVVVRQAPAKIHVEFRSENGSIGFKMQYRELGDNPDKINLPPCDEYLDENKPSCNVQFVSPLLRMQAHLTPVDKFVKAPWPGIYIFRFDNTFGWFTSRRIIFRIQLVESSS